MDVDSHQAHYVFNFSQNKPTGLLLLFLLTYEEIHRHREVKQVFQEDANHYYTLLSNMLPGILPFSHSHLIPLYHG